ncbi:helix-turn-helix domain-containing protein [Curtanaerobium respiraculi]|uniref:helix-turn-helix domain-containing protein n=1 Tax=Curtanaerobium respiraculi TaxID=2949669 RepID=UPI0024B34750|nr:XRE family transcriptional regulator [Curtanaerobium respiraculi]
MEINNEEVAHRIKSLREDIGISMQEMAQATGRTLSDYMAQESGRKELDFTFLSKCADAMGVTEIELLTGEAPHLKGYSLVRKGDGLNLNRNSFYEYLHVAPNLSQNHCEPFIVTIPYRAEEQGADLPLAYHEGLELDYVLEGRIRFQYEDRTKTKSEEIANPGDCLLYDSGNGHGLSALDGKPARILAVVMKPNSTAIR